MKTVIIALVLGTLCLAQAHPVNDPFSDPDHEYGLGSLWHSEDSAGFAHHANIISWDGDGPAVWQWMRGKTGGLAGWLNPWQEGIVNIMVSTWYAAK
jgi:hypothetical protein